MNCELCKSRPATHELYDPPTFIKLKYNPIVCEECGDAAAEKQWEDSAKLDATFFPRGRFAEIFGGA